MNHAVKSVVHLLEISNGVVELVFVVAVVAGWHSSGLMKDFGVLIFAACVCTQIA